MLLIYSLVLADRDSEGKVSSCPALHSAPLQAPLSTAVLLTPDCRPFPSEAHMANAGPK